MSGGDRHGTCDLCRVYEASPGSAEAGATGMVVAYVDDEVIGLVERDVAGGVLAPRRHAAGLSTMPAQAGAVLGALRRMVEVVQTWYGASGAVIEPTTALPGSAGHVAYHVVPTFDHGAEASRRLPSADVATATKLLSAALGDPFAAR